MSDLHAAPWEQTTPADDFDPTTVTEEQLAQMMDEQAGMIAGSFLEFTRLCKIKTKDKGIQPLVLNKAQRYILAVMLQMEREGLPIRVILLKGRQQGGSTLGQAWLCWKAFTVPGTECMTIGETSQTTGKLFEKTAFYFQNLPDWFREPLAKIIDSSKRGQQLVFGAPFHSALYTDSGEKEDAGRGSTFQHLHATELPSWANAYATMSESVFNTILDVVGTSILLESTAKGVGDYFHSMWLKAVAGDSEFWPAFVPWYWEERYQRPWRENDQPITFEEEAVRELARKGYTLRGRHYTHELTDEQLLWRRSKIANYASEGAEKNGNLSPVEVFQQEFPTNPDEAFRASGSAFLKDEIITAHRQTVTEPLLKCELQINNDPGEKPDAEFIEVPGGRHWFWQLPEAGRRYVITADIADTGADLSTIQVVKQPRNATELPEQVAEFVGHIEALDMAEPIFHMARIYRMWDEKTAKHLARVTVAPERNSIGAIVVSALSRMGCPGLYRRVQHETVNQNEANVYGWLTSPQNRGPMLEMAGGVIRSMNVVIRSKRLLDEFTTFVYKTSKSGLTKAEAQSGRHDDLIMAFAIALNINDAHKHVTAKPTTSRRRRRRAR